MQYDLSRRMLLQNGQVKQTGVFRRTVEVKQQCKNTQKNKSGEQRKNPGGGPGRPRIKTGLGGKHAVSQKVKDNTAKFKGSQITFVLHKIPPYFSHLRLIWGCFCGSFGARFLGRISFFQMGLTKREPKTESPLCGAMGERKGTPKESEAER